MRTLFIYWKVAGHQAADALAAAQAFQSQLRGQQAALRTGLYCRDGDGDGGSGRTDRATSTTAAIAPATLMETYALPPAGIDAALQDALTTAGSDALGHWSLGPRHVEAFDTVTDPAR